jgi:NAD(P)H-quinone oxidoreductase subunit 6
LVTVVVGWMVQLIGRASWAMKPLVAPVATTNEIGNQFLTTYILPFEVASMVLLAALIGAVAISRKEVRG